MKYLIVLLAFVLVSCDNVENSVDDKIYYVIKPLPKFEKSNDKNGETLPPPPPLSFYGDYNFILTDTNQVYYHDNHLYWDCVHENYNRPPRLYLSPDSIVKIELNDLTQFLNRNIIDSSLTEGIYSVFIASTKDTIKNVAFEMIMDCLKRKRIRTYGIRIATEEELFVLDAKVSNTQYRPDKIKWKQGFSNNYEDIEVVGE